MAWSRRCLLFCLLVAPLAAQDVPAWFTNPPAAARPWVYWFWLSGNVTRAGITADLAAMARVGIGGVLIMEVDQGAPAGPAPFAGQRWRELFAFATSEANRLGLQVNMNNDAGWCGSGGPWITPDQAMQKLTWSETAVTGPGPVTVNLPRPPTVRGYYREVAVLAYPRPVDDRFRLDLLPERTAVTTRHFANTADYPAAPAGTIVPRPQVRELTGQMDATGKLTWDAPDGRWVVLRLGHTLTGAVNAPAPAAGRGLESDKLSREATRAHFAGLMGQLCDDVGPLAGPTLSATHVDSWETGSQNWTPRFREEFRRLRGYDLLTWLPVVTGRVLDSREASERFLWDLRRTISDLICSHYADELRTLAHQRGLKLTIEAYGEPADDLAYAGRADEPMGEFWSYGAYGAASTLMLMSSAAHVYGARIIGAEAFTATDAERWQAHPGTLKAMGDWAFCEGINRFVFHRYAMQPWTNRAPGMSMGPWGLHYERTNTWWDDLGPYHTYLSRCQQTLRQGTFVADVLYLAPEGAPAHYVPPAPRPDALVRPGYNFDACPAEALFSRVQVRDGRLCVPDGPSYRVLVLPAGGALTPALLRRVKELVLAGATVVGERPRQSPSLSGYPDCDSEVQALAQELWGDPTPGRPAEQRLGRGRVIAGRTAEDVLRADGVPPDFAHQAADGGSCLRWIHRRDGDTDLYFVANELDEPVEPVAAFRVTGRQPELWWPESGRRTWPAMWRSEGGVTRLPLRLGPSESVFVVFRRPGGPNGPVQSLSHPLGQLAPREVPPPAIEVQRATYGPPGDAARTIDVAAQVRALLAGGQRSFQVARLAEGRDPAYGVVKTARIECLIGGRPAVLSGTDPETIVFGLAPLPVTVERASYGPPGDAKRTIDVTERVRHIAAGGRRRFAVVEMAAGFDPAPMVVKTLRVDYTLGAERHSQSASDGETFRFRVPGAVGPVQAVTCADDGAVTVEVDQPGSYALAGAGPPALLPVAAWPESITVKGPWAVQFTGPAAPQPTELPELVSWSRHRDAAVRHFAGRGTYRGTVTVPDELLAQDLRTWLDLGRVEVMARVRLNGAELGLLWRAPYRVELTGHLRAGANELQVTVVNQWINRLIGDESLPEDSPRRRDGTCGAWPEWVYGDGASPTGRTTFTSWRLWRQTDALVDSGLLGPVTVSATRLVRP